MQLKLVLVAWKTSEKMRATSFGATTAPKRSLRTKSWRVFRSTNLLLVEPSADVNPTSTTDKCQLVFPDPDANGDRNVAEYGNLEQHLNSPARSVVGPAIFTQRLF
jgi:hypothetical protein